MAMRKTCGMDQMILVMCLSIQAMPSLSGICKVRSDCVVLCTCCVLTSIVPCWMRVL